MGRGLVKAYPPSPAKKKTTSTTTTTPTTSTTTSALWPADIALPYASQLAATGFNKYESLESVLEKCGIKPPSPHVYDSITNQELIDLAKSAKLDIKQIKHSDEQPPMKRRRNVEKVCPNMQEGRRLGFNKRKLEGESQAIAALSRRAKNALPPSSCNN